MQGLVLVAMVPLFFLDYLAGPANLISEKFTLFSELIAIVIGIVVVALFARNKAIYISPKYLLWFFLFILLILVGNIVNVTSSGAVVGGMRIYFKYLPIFLLPMVYQFSDQQISVQLKFVLFLAFLQIPVSLAQRFILYSDINTGDVVRGTMLTGAFVSIFILCVISVLLAFYLKDKLSKKSFFLMIVLLIIPTTINETKGTLVLLPIAVFIPLLFMQGNAYLKRKMIPIVISFSILFGIFVGLYNYMQSTTLQHAPKIGEFFTDPDRIIAYLAPRTTRDTTKDLKAGRVDFLIAPIQFLSKDPVLLSIGLGMGNVGKTPFELLSGDYGYLRDDKRKVGQAVSVLLWEMGIIGVLLVYVLMFLIFLDARRVSKGGGLIGDLGLGWMGVTAVMAVVLLYKNVIPVNALSFVFWFFSGHVIAAAAKMRYSERNASNIYPGVTTENAATKS